MCTDSQLGPIQPAAGDILARPSDEPEAIATETVRIINNQSFGTAVFQDGNRIHFPDLSSTSSGIFHNSTLNFANATPENIEGDSFTVHGVTYTFTRNPISTFALPDNAVDILFTETFTSADFATAATTAINNKLANRRPRGTRFDTVARDSQ